MLSRRRVESSQVRTFAVGAELAVYSHNSAGRRYTTPTSAARGTLKLQDWTLTDEFAVVDIAGLSQRPKATYTGLICVDHLN